MNRYTRNGYRPFPAALWQAVLIVLLGSVIGLAYNGLRGDGIPLVGSVRVVKFDNPALVTTSAAPSDGEEVSSGVVEEADPGSDGSEPALTVPEAPAAVAKEPRPSVVEPVPAEVSEKDEYAGVEVFSPLPAAGPAEREQDAPGPMALDLAQALELFEGGLAVFVDARMPGEFAAGHIPGALNLPYDDLESHLDVLNYLPEDGLVVTYCDGSECELSLELADELTAMGLAQVRVFFGGWEQWREAGHPTEEGEAVLPY